MRKPDAESIVTKGVDTTGMTPKEVEALIAQKPSPAEVEFYQLLRVAERKLLERPDYAQFDEMERRREIGTFGIDVTGKTPEDVKALDDPSTPEFKAAYLEALHAAQNSLLDGRPDYAALNAAYDKKERDAA